MFQIMYNTANHQLVCVTSCLNKISLHSGNLQCYLLWFVFIFVLLVSESNLRVANKFNFSLANVNVGNITFNRNIFQPDLFSLQFLSMDDLNDK